MSKDRPSVKLLFLAENFQREVDDALERGVLSHVLVEVGGVDLYPVYFYSIDEVQGYFTARSGHSPCEFVAETGMIILPQITLERMEKAVQRLFDDGYFANMRPLSQTQLAIAKNCIIWPPDRDSDTTSISAE